MKKQQSVFSKVTELFGDLHANWRAISPPTEEEEKWDLAQMIGWRQSSYSPPWAVPQEADPVSAESQDSSQTIAPEVLVPSRATRPAPDVGGAPEIGGAAVSAESQDSSQTIAPVVQVPPLAIKPAPDEGGAPEMEEAAVQTHTLGLTFVLVPAGILLMGSPEQELGRSDDEITHEVTISQSFSLQTTPVTQGQWQAIMGRDERVALGEAHLPVTGVNWQDCQEFLARLNSRGEGTYRLPTEAEWEHACRGGNPGALATGELTTLYCELDPTLDDIGWYCGNSGRRPQPVAQKRPNAWGLYDMHGNVAEWCQDWYGPFADTPRTDPQGPPSGPGRVLRGGSWFSSAKNCRSAARFHWPPQSRSQLQTLGFRLVKIT
jgi:formylglycine-generating enzyme required for sulfatase activity